jgi:hypothetical protein
LTKRQQGPRHLFIPDTQIKPGVSIEHIRWAARYAAAKLPHKIVIAGDWYDMASLSYYDKNKLASHGRNYADDIEAGDEGLRVFDQELRKHAPKSYKPELHATLGNHEQRIETSVQVAPELFGKLSFDDLAFKQYGWKVHPFLRPVKLNGVTYVHFCPLNANGRVSSVKFGAPSALAMARRMMTTTVAGHRQGLDVATIETPGGRVRGVIAGSFYRHTESYLGEMGNSHWQGILMLNDIQRGDFDLVEVSLAYLGRRFG